jgi:hypothetical protein
MTQDPPPTSGAFQIDPDIQRRIEAYARAAGMAPGDVVRHAFEAYEEDHNGIPPEDANQPSTCDVLSRAGLIGCIKSAPDTPMDLATNPEHMERFGRE